MTTRSMLHTSTSIGHPENNRGMLVTTNYDAAREYHKIAREQYLYHKIIEKLEDLTKKADKCKLLLSDKLKVKNWDIAWKNGKYQEARRKQMQEDDDSRDIF